jgi:single-stranded-DNA-specific exonuclease
VDLAALATVCDMVPLVGENRELVKEGLLAIARTLRPGLRALLRATNPSGGEDSPDAETLSFRIGPRLNAAGRLKDAGAALELLTTADEARAEELAGELTELNRQRQQMLEEALEIASELVDQQPATAPAIIIGDARISRGIVGLVASRLTELHGKPAFVYEQSDDGCVGSARGVKGFDVVAALDRAHDLLTRHGGHQAAGGFAMPVQAMAALRERLWEASHEQLRSPRPQELHVDTTAALDELNPRVLAYMAAFAPCGVGNPAPVIMSRDVWVHRPRAVGDGKHLMADLHNGRVKWRAFAFGRGPDIAAFGKQIDIVYSVEKGSRGFGPRLRLLDWREPDRTGVVL